jgi:hypothetical protein
VGRYRHLPAAAGSIRILYEVDEAAETIVIINVAATR